MLSNGLVLNVESNVAHVIKMTYRELVLSILLAAQLRVVMAEKLDNFSPEFFRPII